MLQDKNFLTDIQVISEEMKGIYQDLIYFSDEIIYRNGEGIAGDDLKTLAAELIKQVEKIYPVDY